MVAVFGTALLIELSDDAARHISLLGGSATGVPNGVRLPARAGIPATASISAFLSALGGPPTRTPRAGDQATVGGGRLRLGRLDLVLAREWSTRIPVGSIPADAAAALSVTIGDAPRGIPDALPAALAAALRSGDGTAVAGAAAELVGVGAGLTPGGDDVLAGALAGLHATGHTDIASVIGLACGPRLSGTTPISAELARLAIAGHASLEVLAVLRALRVGSPGALRSAATRLLAVGHTSGADLAFGLVAGLTTGRPGKSTEGLSPAGPPLQRPRDGRVATPAGQQLSPRTPSAR